MNPKKFLIIDDEPLAMNRLERLLMQLEPQSTAVKLYSQSALIALLQVDQNWDALFVDIEMPDINGIELVKAMGDEDATPPTVFCTAHVQYGASAFKTSAIDYLLKPVAVDELKDTLARCYKSRDLKSRLQQIESNHSTPTNEVEDARQVMVSVCSGRHRHMLPFSEIYFFRADRKITEVVSRRGTFVTDLSLDHLEAQLAMYDVFRCHRSVLINMQHVLTLTTNDQCWAQITEHHVVPVSRRQKSRLIELIRAKTQML